MQNYYEFMPEIWRRKTSIYSIILWHSTESLMDLADELTLTFNDKIEWQSFKSESRKREWLTVRNILKKILPHSSDHSIKYNENGKPYLLANHIISISHTRDYVTLILTDNLKVGIDIEHIHQRIDKLSEKFLSDTERKIVVNENRLKILHVIWGAKEVLFKIHSIGEIDFKRDLLVHPFIYSETGEVHASIIKKGYVKDYIISYEELNDHILTWAIDPN